ncbi:hypothetical protein LX36DRAFT_383311 [Colletotrichum falcatum]|nr:hypothetical protein LX36DRAFT_383311 [Colletotrichum falcatum]
MHHGGARTLRIIFRDMGHSFFSLSFFFLFLAERKCLSHAKTHAQPGASLYRPKTGGTLIFPRGTRVLWCWIGERERERGLSLGTQIQHTRAIFITG